MGTQIVQALPDQPDSTLTVKRDQWAQFSLFMLSDIMAILPGALSEDPAYLTKNRTQYIEILILHSYLSMRAPYTRGGESYVAAAYSIHTSPS